MKFWGRKVYGVWPISIFETAERVQSPFICTQFYRKDLQMKISEYKSYDDLPLFLNAAMVAKALGIAPSSSYELLHEADFPVLKVGSRIVVPKEKFMEWVYRHTGGDAH